MTRGNVGGGTLLALVMVGAAGWWLGGRQEPDSPHGPPDRTSTSFQIAGREPIDPDANASAAGDLQAHTLPATASLVIRLRNVRPGEGTIRLAIFWDEQGFPNVGGRRISLEPTATLTQFTVDDLATGRYAVSAFQDLNDNGLLDKGAFGVPAEPYGFSNDARGQFGPPTFAAAAFSLPSDPHQVDVVLK